jgi:hypothetical protein
LPIEIRNGESEQDAFVRFLKENDFIESKGDRWRIGDRDKVNNFNPNLLKILDVMIMSSIRAEIDEWIDLGYAYMTADEEGNIVYELTEMGQEVAGTED